METHNDKNIRELLDKNDKIRGILGSAVNVENLIPSIVVVRCLAFVDSILKAANYKLFQLKQRSLDHLKNIDTDLVNQAFTMFQLSDRKRLSLVNQKKTLEDAQQLLDGSGTLRKIPRAISSEFLGVGEVVKKCVEQEDEWTELGIDV